MSRYRKLTESNNNYMNNTKQDYGLHIQEVSRLKQKFSKYEKQGVITEQDLRIILYELLNLQENNEKKAFEEKIIQQQLLAQQKNDKFQLVDLITGYKEGKLLKELLEEEETNSEYIDAFVALGGNPDMSGEVEKNKIISVLQDEFELKLNLKEFIEKLDQNGDNQLSFIEFVQLFESSFLDDTVSKQSFATYLTRKSQKLLVKSTLKPGFVEYRDKEFEKLILRDGKDKTVNKEFQIKDRDFEKWYAMNG